jgi:hypothetical protein
VSGFQREDGRKIPIRELIETEKMELFYLSHSKERRIKTGLVLAHFFYFQKIGSPIILVHKINVRRPGYIYPARHKTVG